MIKKVCFVIGTLLFVGLIVLGIYNNIQQGRYFPGITIRDNEEVLALVEENKLDVAAKRYSKYIDIYPNDGPLREQEGAEYKSTFCMVRP